MSILNIQFPKDMFFTSIYIILIHFPQERCKLKNRIHTGTAFPSMLPITSDNSPPSFNFVIFQVLKCPKHCKQQVTYQRPPITEQKECSSSCTAEVMSLRIYSRSVSVDGPIIARYMCLQCAAVVLSELLMLDHHVVSLSVHPDQPAAPARYTEYKKCMKGK